MRWSVRRVLMPAVTDVEVEVPAGTPFAAVRAQVLDAVGAAAGDVVSVGGTPVAGGATVGRWPLLHGAELLAGPASPGTTTPAPGGRVGGGPAAPVALVAVTGPDSGQVLPLRTGGTVVGRHPSADAVLNDPDTSRRHCRVVLTPAGAEVTDLGSTNGTAVVPPRAAGRPPPIARSAPPTGGPGTPAPLGSQIVLGSTRLEVRALPSPDGDPGRGDRGDGTVVHSPVPRSTASLDDRVFVLPAPPSVPDRRRLPWATALVPLIVAVPMALWWGSAVFLLFGLLGPMMLVASAVSDRRDGRRKIRTAAAEHAAAVAAVRTEAAVAAADAADARRHAHPDAERVLRSAVLRDGRLWERTPESPGAFRVRVGTGVAAVGVRLDSPQTGVVTGGPGRGLPVTVDGVPVVVDVQGGVSIDGPDAWVDGIARCVVGRLCTALAPEHLTVTVRAASPAGRRTWAWTEWLPHVADEATVTGEARVSGEGPARLHLVIVDRPGPSSAAVLADLAGRPSVALLVAGGTSPAPGCAWRLSPGGESGTGIRLSGPDESGGVGAVAETVGAWWAERLARALAPVRTAGGEHGRLPGTVTLAELLVGRPGTLDGAAVAERWDDHGPDTTLAAPVGVGPAGPVVVDLVTDGPHALVAGTTGSGKSELLRSLVLGLACCHPPDEVAFVLVDFKGGSTFAEAAGLPHTVETVTDLDIHAAGRVLTSLRAELRRRERVLRDAGTADLASYRRSASSVPSGAGAMPRLVVVIDEFRVLAEEAPDVLEGLVRVAAVGRSLGVHLVLATQRPAGIVSADIRANTALRIALRVEDATESRDVADVPDAARLPRSAPGRAVLSRSGLRTTVQTARVAPPDPGPPVRVHVVGRDEGDPAGDPRTGPQGDDDGSATRSAALALVAACHTAMTSTGRRPPAAPWLPPLPTTACADEIPRDDREQAPGPSLPLALLDLPDAQRRGGLHWRPAADGALVVSGGPRSGRSTALAALAAAAIRKGMPTVAVRGDHSAVLPPGAVVIDRHDGDHLADAFTALSARAAAGPAEWACLLIDDADALVESAGERPRLLDLMTTTIRGGTAAQVAVAVAGGRDLLTARAFAGGRLRVLLRPADPADAVLAGVARRDLPHAMPPGRCLVTGFAPHAPVQGQIALPPDGEAMSAHDTASGDPKADETVVRDTARPHVVPAALPSQATWPAQAPVDWPDLPLGVGTAGPLTLDVSGFPVVAGPPGSGRSTVLRTLVAGAAVVGAETLVLGARHHSTGGPPIAAAGVRHGTGADVRSAVAAAGADPTARLLVLVDDLDRAGPDVDALVADLAAGGVGPGVGLVATAGAAWLAGSFRGFAAEARRRGHGLLLHPGRHDGRDILGVPVEPQESRLPGRGVLVRSGRITRVQVLRPPALGPAPDRAGAAPVPTARPPPRPRRPPRRGRRPRGRRPGPTLPGSAR